MMDPPLPALLQSARYTEVGAVIPEVNLVTAALHTFPSTMSLGL